MNERITEEETPQSLDAQKAAKKLNWETTQRLRDAAVLATDALSNHLESIGDMERMYKTNAALHQLRDVC